MEERVVSKQQKQKELLDKYSRDCTFSVGENVYQEQSLRTEMVVWTSCSMMAKLSTVTKIKSDYVTLRTQSHRYRMSMM